MCVYKVCEYQCVYTLCTKDTTLSIRMCIYTVLLVYLLLQLLCIYIRTVHINLRKIYDHTMGIFHGAKFDGGSCYICTSVIIRRLRNLEYTIIISEVHIFALK